MGMGFQSQAEIPNGWQACQAANVAGHGGSLYGLEALSAGATPGQPGQPMQMQVGIPASGNQVADTVIGTALTVGNTYLQYKIASDQLKLQQQAEAQRHKQELLLAQRGIYPGSGGGGSSTLLIVGGLLVLGIVGVVVYKASKRS